MGKPLPEGLPLEAEEASSAGLDRSMQALIAAILVVVVLILTVLLYAVAGLVINPPAPRTAQEFVLTRAEQMVKANPANGQYWADYVNVLVVRKRYSDAERVLARARKAVGKDRSLVVVNNAHLEMLIQREQFKEALAASDTYLKDNDEARKKMLAELYGRGITVPDNYNDKWLPAEVDMLGYRALAAVGLKKHDIAIEALTRAWELEPDAADVLTFRGRVYVLKGDKDSLEKAREDFLSALKFIPDSEQALDGLAQVDKLTGTKTPRPTNTASPH